MIRLLSSPRCRLAAADRCGRLREDGEDYDSPDG
jgi:hypothetical protein